MISSNRYINKDINVVRTIHRIGDIARTYVTKNTSACTNQGRIYSIFFQRLAGLPSPLRLCCLNGFLQLGQVLQGLLSHRLGTSPGAVVETMGYEFDGRYFHCLVSLVIVDDMERGELGYP